MIMSPSVSGLPN